MEDIDGGLHPAVDGQSLDEDKCIYVPIDAILSCFGQLQHFPGVHRHMFP